MNKQKAGKEEGGDKEDRRGVEISRLWKKKGTLRKETSLNENLRKVRIAVGQGEMGRKTAWV